MWCYHGIICDARDIQDKYSTYCPFSLVPLPTAIIGGGITTCHGTHSSLELSSLRSVGGCRFRDLGWFPIEHSLHAYGKHVSVEVDKESFFKKMQYSSEMGVQFMLYGIGMYTSSPVPLVPQCFLPVSMNVPLLGLYWIIPDLPAPPGLMRVLHGRIQIKSSHLTSQSLGSDALGT